MSWRFLVMESDEAPARDWLGAVVQLPLRIAALYTSGKRSIHALVRVDAPDKAAWDRERDALRPALVTLGADPASLSAVRLTRLPGCRRGNRLQRLLYLNPAPNAAPLCELQPARVDGAAVWLRWHEALTSDPAALDDPAERPEPPAALLTALAYYAAADPRCRAARDHWRPLANAGSLPVQTPASPVAAVA